MSENLRLSRYSQFYSNFFLVKRALVEVCRGNKGSLFILQKVSNFTADQDAEWAAKNLRIDSSAHGNGEVKERETMESKSSSISLPKDTPSLWSLLSFNNIKTKGKPTIPKKKKVCLILPAQLSRKTDYQDLERVLLEAKEELVAFTAPLVFSDWILGLLPSFFSKEYFFGKLEYATSSL